MKFLSIALPICLISALVWGAPAAATPDDGDTVTFKSDQFVSKFWKKRNPGKEFVFTEVRAKLRKPDGAGPFPLVVFLHGCGGLFDNIEIWADWFLERGYASLAPDSFRPRGHETTCDDFEKVTQKERVDDVYGTIKYAETLPFIDKNKIVLMGFSNGGVTSLTAIQEVHVQKINSIQGKIVASLGIYPACEVATPPYAVPVLIVVGDADQWTPPEHCERILKMRNRQPLEVHIYPGAHHNFDYPDLDVVKFGKRSKTNRAATEQTRKDVDAFLAKHAR